MSARITITLAEDDDAKARCIAVRRAVFVDEQGVSEEEEVDGADPSCLHVLARSGGVALGAARIMPLGETAKVQRVCVVSDARGRGLGADIMRFAVDVVRADGRFSTVLLGAQIHALDFYRRLGFREEGEDYLDAGIVHRDMRMDL